MPHTPADLDEWSVYADYLMTRGDPKGERIARELAIPAVPTPDQLAAFRAIAPRRGVQPDAAVSLAWCLDHVRVLRLRQPDLHHHWRPRRPSPGALTNTYNLLRGPTLACLEHLEVPVPDRLDREYARLFARIPPTCRRVSLPCPDATPPAVIDELIGMLPSHVRELVLTSGSAALVARFATSRFDRIVLPQASSEVVVALWPVLDAQPHLVLEVRRVHARFHPRTRLGDARDAGLVDLQARPDHLVAIDGPLAHVIARRNPLELQDRFGVIPARAQVADTIPQHHQVEIGPSLPNHLAPALQLARRGDRWTARSLIDFVIDGVAIAANQIVPLPDGAQLGVDGWRARFFARDLDARARAMLA